MTQDNLDVKILKEIQAEKIDTYIKKNNDYGNSVEKSFNEFGDIALLVRMSDKFERLKSLINGKEQMVNDESIDDTLKDLSNYTDILAMLRIKKKYEENQKKTQIVVKQQEEVSYGRQQTS